MLTRLGLIAAVLVTAAMAFAGGADADSRWKFRYYNYDPDYDFYYGPEYVPQPRYYRYLRRDRRAYLYDDDDDNYDGYDPDYYEPQYVPPRKKRRTYVQPPAEMKPKTQAARKKATPISCSKAGEIVSG